MARAPAVVQSRAFCGAAGVGGELRRHARARLRAKVKRHAAEARGRQPLRGPAGIGAATGGWSVVCRQTAVGSRQSAVGSRLSMNKPDAQVRDDSRLTARRACSYSFPTAVCLLPTADFLLLLFLLLFRFGLIALLLGRFGLLFRVLLAEDRFVAFCEIALGFTQTDTNDAHGGLFLSGRRLPSMTHLPRCGPL